MKFINKVEKTWMSQNEWIKIFVIIVLIIISLWIYGGITTDNNRDGLPGIALDEQGMPVLMDTKTGKPIPLQQCTVEKGPRQCRISSEEFITERFDEIVIITSRRKGSTTCCKTVFYGGEAAQDCVTYSSNLPQCPNSRPNQQ